MFEMIYSEIFSSIRLTIQAYIFLISKLDFYPIH